MTSPYGTRPSDPCWAHPNYKGTRAPKYCADCAQVFYEVCRRRYAVVADEYAAVGHRLSKLTARCEAARELSGHITRYTAESTLRECSVAELKQLPKWAQRIADVVRKRGRIRENN